MAASDEKRVASISRHLEFLGYRSRVQDDGWVFAAHPSRPDLCFRTLPFGVHVVALFDIGRLSDGLRTEWLEFANRCNAAGVLAKFALGPRDGGGHLFRASAVFNAAYDRTAFGAFIDAWHTDMALMKHAPAGPEPADGEEADEEAGPGSAEVTH